MDPLEKLLEWLRDEVDVTAEPFVGLFTSVENMVDDLRAQVEDLKDDVLYYSEALERKDRYGKGITWE